MQPNRSAPNMRSGGQGANMGASNAQLNAQAQPSQQQQIPPPPQKQAPPPVSTTPVHSFGYGTSTASPVQPPPQMKKQPSNPPQQNPVQQKPPSSNPGLGGRPRPPAPVMPKQVVPQQRAAPVQQTQPHAVQQQQQESQQTAAENHPAFVPAPTRSGPPKQVNAPPRPRFAVAAPPKAMSQPKLGGGGPPTGQMNSGPVNDGPPPMNPPPTNTMPPPMNQPTGPPPMGGGSGPRPMASRAKAAAAANVSQEDCNAVLSYLQPMIDEYEESEGNKKAGQDALMRLKIVTESLNGQSVSAQVCDILKNIVISLDEKNYQQANSCVKQMTTQHWNEAKEWASAIKALVTFKQRMG